MENFRCIFDGSLIGLQLHELTSDQYRTIRSIAHKEINGQDIGPSEAAHAAVSEILFNRLAGERTLAVGWAYSAAAEFLLLTYDSWLLEDIRGKEYSLFHKNNVPLEKLSEFVKDVCRDARCSVTHPLFSYLKAEATHEELAFVLAAENPCDLNFVHILALLTPGLSGRAGIEILNNFYEELGRGNLSLFHATMRLDMMRKANIHTDKKIWDFCSYHMSELKHFNAYALSGIRRDHHMRLIGMMFATEYLVPQQLDAVVSGWRRVGTAPSDMQYMLDHLVNDVEHGEGWATAVVEPFLLASPGIEEMILLGVFLHIDILSGLYDELYRELRNGSWRESRLAQNLLP